MLSILKVVPEHGIHTKKVNHVNEEHTEEPDDDTHDNLDGHDTPGLVLTAASGAEPVSLLNVQLEHRDHHMLTAAVQG